jgi:hypothetical protein
MEILDDRLGVRYTEVVSSAPCVLQVEEAAGEHALQSERFLLACPSRVGSFSSPTNQFRVVVARTVLKRS